MFTKPLLDQTPIRFPLLIETHTVVTLYFNQGNSDSIGILKTEFLTGPPGLQTTFREPATTSKQLFPTQRVRRSSGSSTVNVTLASFPLQCSEFASDQRSSLCARMNPQLQETMFS